MAHDFEYDICVDFDGVLHANTHGFSSGIMDKAVPGALDFLREAVRHFTVHIFSSRNLLPNGTEDIKAWLTKQGLEASVLKKLTFTREKVPARIYIDDRAFHFTGTFPSVGYIKNFKPWDTE
jgi:hypothetical protein